MHSHASTSITSDSSALVPIAAATSEPLPKRRSQEARCCPVFTSLAEETRTAVDTACAAFHLSLQPQTLRAWACAETFPDGLRPVRLRGRLGWPVADLRRMLGVAP